MPNAAFLTALGLPVDPDNVGKRERARQRLRRRGTGYTRPTIAKRKELRRRRQRSR